MTGISRIPTIKAISNRNGSSASTQTVATAVTTPVSSNRIHWGDCRPGSCLMRSGLGSSECLQTKDHVRAATAECHHLLGGTAMSHRLAMGCDALQQLLRLLSPAAEILCDWIHLRGGGFNFFGCCLKQAREMTVTESVGNHPWFSIFHRFLLCRVPTLWRPAVASQFG